MTPPFLSSLNPTDRFAIESDALYRTNRGAISYPFQWEPRAHPYTYTSAKKTNAWDFPLLLKYRSNHFHLLLLRSAGLLPAHSD